MTTLVAPAGFGKTTALDAWADRLDGPVAWCALEEDDSDPSRFWHALACALARADERLGAPRNMAEVAWTEAVEAREALTELLAQLGAFPDTAVLVVEDLHVVQDAPVVGDTLATFCATCRRRSTLCSPRARPSRCRWLSCACAAPSWRSARTTCG